MTNAYPLAPSHARAALARSSPWTDLGLTAPIFVIYHLGVVLLPIRNAADVVTQELVELAHHDRVGYAALTVGLGAIYVGVLLVLGRGHKLRWQSFAWLAFEGVVYSVAMRLAASAVVGRLFLGAPPDALDALASDLERRFVGLVMSLGAGFYEEIAFRVLLYGVGGKCLTVLVAPNAQWKRVLLLFGWAVVCACAFSAWHHLGTFGDGLDARVFVFRAVCALVFTLIYVTRGFAPVVWTHVVYDIWVLVF